MSVFIGNQRFERIWLMAKTDYLLRYYGSALGVLWALINPLFRVLVFYVVFAYLVFRNREPVFILYLLLGITTWQLFSEATNRGLELLKSKRYLIESVNINKQDLFLASYATAFFAYAITMIIYFFAAILFNVPFTYEALLYYPIILICLGFTAMGTAMMLAVLNGYFKDLKHLWEMVLMLGFWTVPIIWEQDILYESYTWLLYSNPITGLLVNTRNLLMYGTSPDLQLLAFDAVVSVGLFLTGKWALKNYAWRAAEIL